jgi:hypothetical protein
MPEALALGRGIFEEDEDLLTRFFLNNAYFDPSALYVLRDGSRRTLGLGLAIINPAYADPNKIDAAMPCFRLGAMGTEGERHKRVNGMFACVFSGPEAGEVLLGEAVRRFEQAGLQHAAAQAASDQPALVSFYDRSFQRQGSFPILARRLA